MLSQVDLDKMWAELLATRAMCLLMVSFLQSAQSDKAAWRAAQRMMLHQYAETLQFDGHPDQIGMRNRVKAAIDGLIADLARAQTVPRRMQ